MVSNSVFYIVFVLVFLPHLRAQFLLNSSEHLIKFFNLLLEILKAALGYSRFGFGIF